LADLGLKRIETGVDELIQFLKGKKPVDMNVVAKQLKMSSSAIQKWVDFLVEEKIMGVDYKFTKPYIYLIDKKDELEEKVGRELGNYKKKFENAAKKKAVPENKTAYLWKEHLVEKVEEKQEFFYQQAKLRNLENIDSLWEEYKQRVMGK